MNTNEYEIYLKHLFALTNLKCDIKISFSHTNLCPNARVVSDSIMVLFSQFAFSLLVIACLKNSVESIKIAIKYFILEKFCCVD